MLRRQCVRLAAVRPSAVLLTRHTSSVVDPAAVPPPPMHKRSDFAYKGSEKGGEVGARNEAAFVDYSKHVASTTEEKLALPHQVNLLSAMPLLVGLSLVLAAAWGLVLWHLYTAGRYSSVVIERPALAA